MQIAVAPRFVRVVDVQVIRHAALLGLRETRVDIGRVLRSMNTRVIAFAMTHYRAAGRSRAAARCTSRQHGQSALTLPITVHREFVRLALPARKAHVAGRGLEVVKVVVRTPRHLLGILWGPGEAGRTADGLQLVLEGHQQEADQAQQHDLPQHVLVGGQQTVLLPPDAPVPREHHELRPRARYEQTGFVLLVHHQMLTLFMRNPQMRRVVLAVYPAIATSRVVLFRKVASLAQQADCKAAEDWSRTCSKMPERTRKQTKTSNMT